MKILHLVAVVLATASFCCSIASAKPLSEEESGAYYNEKRWECRVQGNRLIQHYSARLTILNKKGEDRGRLSFYESDFVKIKNLQARLIDSNGNVIIKRDKGDFTKACGFDNISIYTDYCHYFTTLSSARYPYTIEYEYTREYRTLFFWPSAILQSGIPVRHAICKLTVPADFELRYRAYHTDLEPEIFSSPDDKSRVYIWEVRDLPALEDVDYVPASESEPAMIRFAAERFEFEGYRFDSCSWQAIGQWYNHLAEDRYCPNRMIEGLAFSADEPQSAVKAVIDWVTENIRYVAIQIGIGGWQPYHAKKTRERGFGDCKDMSTLLISELRNLGIEAFPVLVLTRDEGTVDADFPDNYFNHVIAVALIGSDTVWMDPTCDECRYDELPWWDQDVPVLVMTEKGGELWRTPAASAEDNHTTRATRWFIRNDGKVEISSVMTATGSHGMYLRRVIPGLDADEERQFVNQRFKGADKDFRISSYGINNLDNRELPVEISIEAETIKPVRSIGSVTYFDPFVMSTLSDLEEETLSKRKFSLNLYYPKLWEEHMTVCWDESLAPDSIILPDDDSLDFLCGWFSLQTSREGSELSIKVRKVYDTFTISPDEFEDFDQYRRKVKKALGQPVKFYFK
ncbi:MAG: DUF3857 domain-containing protein [Candidatus Zixiibacteriota bacterium]|nr:MAG: DUF3857 domain-containing protein [candidate division Zixibacteria bacterium]